jgi:hypothetical protein
MPIEIEACRTLAISTERIRDAVNVMLSYQNQDGGWPSYENMRAPAWMETLNPASCFGTIFMRVNFHFPFFFHGLASLTFVSFSTLSHVIR